MTDINEILWGTMKEPSVSWKQGFYFNKLRERGYGLLQNQAGPCGVLAAIQGHIIAETWHNVNDK